MPGVPPKPLCPICEAGASVEWSLRKSGCDIHHCRDCDHCFVSPVPDANALRELYSAKAGYPMPEPGDASDREPAPKFARRLERIRSHRKAGRILDVGCAAGDFLQLAGRLGFDVQGVEMNPDTAARARAAGIPVEVGSLEEAPFEDGAFAVVHLGDVV